MTPRAFRSSALPRTICAFRFKVPRAEKKKIENKPEPSERYPRRRNYHYCAVVGDGRKRLMKKKNKYIYKYVLEYREKWSFLPTILVRTI